MKKIIAILCVVSLLAALFVGCNIGKTPADNTESADKNSTQKVRDYVVMKNIDFKLVFVCGESIIFTDYSYSDDILFSYSPDGASAACITTEGDLLFIHDGKVEKIADHVFSYKFSVSGDSLAFRIRNEMVAEDSTLESGLYLHQRQTGQTVQITADAESNVDSYVVSPDGKTVAYVAEANIDGEKVALLMTYRDGTKEQFLQLQKFLGVKIGCTLISINNDLDVIYVHALGHVCTVNQEGKIKQLCAALETCYFNDTFYTNADHTQLLFTGFGTYISENGEPCKKICDDDLRPIPRANSPFFHDGTNVLTFGEGHITCDYEDLSVQVMRRYNDNTERQRSFWLPNAEGKYEMIAEYKCSEEDPWLDYNGSYLYYMDFNRTLHVMDLKNGGESAVLADNIYSYTVSNNGKKLYYSKSWEKLYRLDRTDVSEMKHEEIDLPSLDAHFSENNELFTKVMNDSNDRNYDLYKITKNGDIVRILQNVLQCTKEDCGMIYVTTEDGYYIIRNGELIQLEVKTMEQ